MKAFFPAFLFLLLPSYALAEDRPVSIMVDLNLSLKEVKAAKEAAKFRNEEMVVIPDLSSIETDQSKFASFNKLRAAFSDADSKLHCLIEKKSDCKLAVGETKESLTQKRSGFKGELLKIVSAADPRFVNSNGKPETIKRVLEKELEKAGSKRKVGSLIISGHSGVSGFGGIAGELSKAELTEINENNPQAKDAMSSVKDVMLWGCYTAGVRSAATDYLALFPNARSIAGFDGRAPTENNSQNMAYLKGFLTQVETVSRSLKGGCDPNDPKRIKEGFGRIMGDLNQMNSAFYIRNECRAEDEGKANSYYFKKDKAECFSDLVKRCQNPDGTDSEEVKKFLAEYANVVKKFGGCLKESVNISPSENIPLPPNLTGPGGNGLPTIMRDPFTESFTSHQLKNEDFETEVAWPDASTGRIKSVYDKMNELSFCPNSSLKDLFGDQQVAENQINAILYLRKFPVFMVNWFKANSEIIQNYNKTAQPENQIRLTEKSSRCEVVQAVRKFETYLAKRNVGSGSVRAPASGPPGPPPKMDPEMLLGLKLHELKSLQSGDFSLRWVD